MTTNKPQETDFIPLILVAVVVYFVMSKPTEKKPDDKPKPIKAVVSETLPNIRTAYRDAFLTAAAKIEAGEITTAEQWTKWIKENAGEKQKEAMNVVYAAIDSLKVPASFAGKEAEISSLNREIAKSW